jgi:hypothetical protein
MLFLFYVPNVFSPFSLHLKLFGTDAMIFKNIFAKKFSEKIGVFDPKQSK